MADPVTGLTCAQVEAIRKHWAGLMKNKKAHGVEIFMTLFQAYPNIKSFFHMFDGMDWDAIRASPKLRAHATNFMMGLNSFIENLDDADCLVILIHKQTVNHNRRKISVDEFKDAFEGFMKYCKDNTDLDEFTTEAWNQALAVVASVMGDHMKEIK